MHQVFLNSPETQAMYLKRKGRLLSTATVEVMTQANYASWETRVQGCFPVRVQNNVLRGKLQQMSLITTCTKYIAIVVN